MKTSVIILSWNTKALLKQCLDSLISSNIIRINSNKNSFKFENYEIIVVDNGSSDGSVEMINEEWLMVKRKKSSAISHQPLVIKLIANQTNLGFAKGNNQGIKVAKGDLIMLLNSDTIVHPGAIEKLANSFRGRVTPCQAVSPMLILPNGKPQIDYYMKFPNLWQIFLYHNPIIRPLALRIPFIRNKIVSSQLSHLRGVLPKSFEVDQLPGAALMASKKMWNKVGLLDENYHFLYEDVDWCFRAKKQGFKLVVIPQAKITHIGGASWKQKLKEDSFEFYKQYFTSMLLFVEKHYGQRKKLIFRVALIKNWILSSLLMLPVAIFSLKGWKKVLDKLKLISYFRSEKTFSR